MSSINIKSSRSRRTKGFSPEISPRCFPARSCVCVTAGSCLLVSCSPIKGAANAGINLRRDSAGKLIYVRERCRYRSHASLR